ncbi:MAG: hypothetical protein GY866_42870 [Proteobacteria bacterium]|nr:hypothetical protein [Pseudomonadota bacterium]
MDRNDEFMHPAGEDRAWSESYYFNFVDSDREIGMFTRMGFRANEGWADGLHVLFLGGDRLAFTYGRRDSPPDDDRLQVGGLRLERIEPFKEWIVNYEGPAQDIADGSILITRRKQRPEGWYRPADLNMCLSFESTADPFYDDSGKRGHFEQTGAVTGRIDLDGEKWSVDGWGVRDKSWGPRNWSPVNPGSGSGQSVQGGPSPAVPPGPLHFVTWLSINFGSDLGLGCSCFRDQHGRMRGRGWFQRNGKNQPLLDISIESDFQSNPLMQQGLRLTGTTGDGRKIEVDGKVLTICPTKVPMPGGATFINEGLARFDLEGRVGFGIAEYWLVVGKEE